MRYDVISGAEVWSPDGERKWGTHSGATNVIIDDWDVGDKVRISQPLWNGKKWCTYPWYIKGIEDEESPEEPPIEETVPFELSVDGFETFYGELKPL